jgi:crossover junction endodeoxyribonuclease RuvC
MIVLGIDPGSANTGFGVVVAEGSRLTRIDHGVIVTSPGCPPEQRLADIHAAIADLIARHRVHGVAVEELYFGANARSAFAVGQARGVVLLAAGQAGVPVRSYTPQQVKQAVCGSGRAAKDQIGRMVQRLLALPAMPRPDHAADALAVAIADLNHAPLRRLTAARPGPASRPAAASRSRAGALGARP